jgi:phosphate transport system protein
MISKKDEAINTILSDFEAFANLLLNQLNLLEKDINSDEEKLCNTCHKEILENEKKLDKLEVKISDKIVNTIALYQPVASDIRKLIACYRIIISLERVGDMVVNILGHIEKVKGTPVFEHLLDVISNMLMQASNMVNKALLAFTTDDREFAIWTIKNDSVVDEINHKMLKKAIKKSSTSKEDKEMLTNFISMNGMVANIERIADHATNIAEAAIYSIEGKDIRHVKNVE